MGLPEPTLSFTIPSIHDDTTIDARVYHPANTTTDPFGREQTGKRGAIIAHPYAPLGGSYDDPVVAIVAAQILKEGFTVCTFNFRYETLSSLEASIILTLIIEAPMDLKVTPVGLVFAKGRTISQWLPS
jgi:hypothetical protein